MRKELGKPTREFFFSRLGEIAPEFRRCSTHDIKGFTWSVLRQQSNLCQWLTFQRHKYDNAFTVEISWYCESESPFQIPCGCPNDTFTPNGCRFRLDAFWEPLPRGGFWWHVWDPPPHLFDIEDDDAFMKALVSPPETIDLQKALPRIRAAVEDAMARIQEYALPYFDRVAEWAAKQER